MTSRLVLSSLLLATSACASLHPLPPEQRDPYFLCREVTLDQSEINLAEHGFVPKAGGNASLSTEVSEVFLEAEDAQVWVPDTRTERLVDIHRSVRVRILVYQLGANAVRYKPFWGHRGEVMGHRGETLFPVAERLYREQVDHAPTYQLLARTREAVCGVKAPINRPWEEG